MFKYIGEKTIEVEKLLKESIVTLEWDNQNLKYIIIDKMCPDCNSKLLFADRWYDLEQVVIFKRLCPSCRQLFILSGYFKNYNKAKEHYINRFRMHSHHKTKIDSFLNRKSELEKYEERKKQGKRN